MGINLSKITAFLDGMGTDHHGRTLDDILKLEDSWWDECHDFIQWLFPLPRASRFFVGDNCPILIEDDLKYYYGHGNLIFENLFRSTERYLKFLGLEINLKSSPGKYYIYTGPNFVEQEKYWLKANDHNHLRINRILQCLVLFGLDNLAKAIFRCLVMIKCEFSDCITDVTMVYWRNAISGYSY